MRYHRINKSIFLKVLLLTTTYDEKSSNMSLEKKNNLVALVLGEHFHRDVVTEIVKIYSQLYHKLLVIKLFSIYLLGARIGRYSIDDNRDDNPYGPVCNEYEKITDPRSFDQLQWAEFRSFIPSEISLLRGLTVLDVSFCKANEMINVCSLRKLTTLNLSYNNLSYLPGEIGSLLNMITLNLNHNKLINLPKELGLLRNMVTLDLSFNSLEHLPEEICLLQKMTRLLLNNNKLSNLPEKIGLLSNLIELNLNGNLLTNLPQQLRHLSNLRSLDLTHNWFQQVPSVLRVMKYNKVSVFLYRNFITKPQKIGRIITQGHCKLQIHKNFNSIIAIEYSGFDRGTISYKSTIDNSIKCIISLDNKKYMITLNNSNITSLIAYVLNRSSITTKDMKQNRNKLSVINNKMVITANDVFDLVSNLYALL